MPLHYLQEQGSERYVHPSNIGGALPMGQLRLQFKEPKGQWPEAPKHQRKWRAVRGQACPHHGGPWRL